MARATTSPRRPAAPVRARRARARGHRRSHRASDPTAAHDAPPSISCGSAKYRNDGSTGARRDDRRFDQLRNPEHSATCAAAARVSTAATAQLVVPRSMPTRNAESGMLKPRAFGFPDVQLQLPAPVAVRARAPQLERADLGDAALERHRRQVGRVACSSLPVSVTSSGPSSSRSSPQSSMSAPGRSFLRIVELRKRNSAGSPTARPNSRPAIARARAFFHAERHDAERFERRREAGHGRQRALDADVVAARRAAADAHAAPARARARP